MEDYRIWHFKRILRFPNGKLIPIELRFTSDTKMSDVAQMFRQDNLMKYYQSGLNHKHIGSTIDTQSF